MEIGEPKDTIEVENSKNNIEMLEENKFYDRRESLYGLTKDRVCESCEKIEKCMSFGQSIRRCEACTKIKDIIEKKSFHDLQSEEMIGEERIEMDFDSKEPLIIATSKYVMEMNMTLEEDLNDNKKILCNEDFVVEHEHIQEHGVEVVNTPNVITSEDGKVVKKKEFFFPNKKEYKCISALEPMVKKESFGYFKGRNHLEKDTSTLNEEKEQTIEMLDVQKIKEETDLEKRERGWIVGGRNASHSKVMPVKNVITLDGCLVGKEQKDKVKVKNLKEKLDAQRILSLVAKRSESRITSPIHRRDPNKLKDDGVEAPYFTNNVIPPNTLYDKNLKTIKLDETHHELPTHHDNGLICNDNDEKAFHQNINEEVQKLQPQVTQHVDIEAIFSSPKKVSNCTNENPLHGTQRILNLLAKRNRSRFNSPTQGMETNRIKDSKSMNIIEDEFKEQYKIRKPNFMFHSILHDRQQDLPTNVQSPRAFKKNCNENNSSCNNTNEKNSNLDPNLQMGLGAQTCNLYHDTKLNIPSNNNNNDSLSSDNPIYSRQQILELNARRGDSNITSPKKEFNDDTKNKFSICIKENEFSRLEPTTKTNNTLHQPCNKEDHENTLSKISHLNSKTYNHNELVHKKNEEYNKSKLLLEEDTLSKNSPSSNFSRPSSLICHINDNPLYGTKFESESSNSSFSNTNESHLCAINQSPSTGHSLIGIPSNNLIQESSKICDKDDCTNLSINDSSEMTLFHKSATIISFCKSPEPGQNTNKNLPQIESKKHNKEVEHIEKEDIFVSTFNNQLKDNTRIKEKPIKEHKNKNEKCKQEGDILNTLSETNVKHLETTFDGVKKKSSVEKESISHYNLKVVSSINTSKGHVIFWPMHVLFRGIIYPFRLILKLILYFVYVLKAMVFGIIRPFKMLKIITYPSVDNVRSKISKHSQNGCNSSQGYLGGRCATKTYILIVLSSLLLPSLFDFDFYLVNRFIEGQVIIREALNFDYTKEHPTAMVNLLPQQIMGKPKGYLHDKEVMATQAFPPSHIYHISIHLTVPESQYNHEIGMFQVVVETFSARGHSLNKASRASMLRYHSPPVKYIKSILMGIPIVLGLSQESQTLSIRVMESQSENENFPTAKVRVDIEPKAGHKIGLGVPEIYHSELQVIAHNPYLREVARNWVWSLYMYSGLALFIFEALLIMCCSRRGFSQKLNNDDTSKEVLSQETKLTQERTSKKIQTPRKLHKQHIYFPKKLPLALPSSSN